MRVFKSKLLRAITFSCGFFIVLVGCQPFTSVPKKLQAGTKDKSISMSGLPGIRAQYRVGEVDKLCNTAIKRAAGVFEAIAVTPAGKRTPENTLLAYEKAWADLSDDTSPLTFMSFVSTDSATSKEGSQCEDKIREFAVEVSSRRNLYTALKAIKKGLSPEHKRLLAEHLRAFEDNGLQLADEQVAKVKELKQQLANLETRFTTNLNQNKSTVEYEPAELRGLPEDFLNSLEKTSDGKRYIVTTKVPHFVRVMDQAPLAETRRKMLLAYETMAAEENTELLEKAIAIRQRIASTLGFDNWADYQTKHRMAKNSGLVYEFLDALKEKLALRNQHDLDQLFDLKKEAEPKAVSLNAWDLRYYSYQLKKRSYQIDDEQVKVYFPAERVIAGVFDIYARLLGVTFKEDPEAKVWSPDVKLYRIVDSKTQKVMASFYTDFVPRAGKYGHAAAFTLNSGRLLADGRYSHPISAIVANFSPPEGDRPSLLTHDEVETLFHEFGHIMHQTLTRAPYASLSGSSVDRDFVEAPSQMLENWVYFREVLEIVSGHYERPDEKIPSSLIDSIVASKDFNQGYFYTRQLMLALFDLRCHTSSEQHTDVTKLYHKTHREVVGLPAIAGSHMPAAFGHLMGGYDAGYYGYLWSKVFAEDMFTRFEKEGLLNPKVGGDYRRVILERGKMTDGFDLLREFLGRDPNPEAFYKMLKVSNS